VKDSESVKLTTSDEWSALLVCFSVALANINMTFGLIFSQQGYFLFFSLFSLSYGFTSVLLYCLA